MRSSPPSQDFQTLAADPQNTEILNTIHSSAFAICLDTESAPSFVAHSRLLWHGAVVPQADGARPQLGLRNRWMDKPLQFVVSADGKAGLVGEHSVMDGTPTATMCDRVLDLIASPAFAASANSPLYANPRGALPVPLDWAVGAETQAAMERASDAALALIGSQALNAVRTPYGKAAVKAFGVSPDGWAQMVIQLAYARLLRAKGWKRNGGTYEAASVRKFFKGRTEAIRVVSEQSDRWVASMDDSQADAKRRVELFKDAVKTHGTYARAAGNGRGVDRHLFGAFPFPGLLHHTDRARAPNPQSPLTYFHPRRPEDAREGERAGARVLLGPGREALLALGALHVRDLHQELRAVRLGRGRPRRVRRRVRRGLR